MSAAVRGSSQRMSSKGSHGSRGAGRSTAAVGRAMLGARPRSKEREDPGMRPAGALRSEDSKTVPTPATNRARQIGDSLEHLLSGAQQGILASKLSGYRPHGGVDFDDEARKLWARLNLDPSVITGGHYNAVDPLWQHPETRAVFYVGNQTAASNLPLLQKHGITHVVNCTDNMPNYHEGSSSIRYHRFDISRFHRQVKTDADADRFVQAMLDFVGSALASGKNVMVHCLAGAHRAGTTGCICLMHFAQLDAKDAVTAQSVADPSSNPSQTSPSCWLSWSAVGAVLSHENHRDDGGCPACSRKAVRSSALPTNGLYQLGFLINRSRV